MHLFTLDHLCDEKHLGGVGLKLSQPEDGVLDYTYLTGLFFIAGLDGGCTDAAERLANDRDQKIQQKNDVEDAANEKNDPVSFVVELKVFVKFSKGHQEGLLPRFEVLFYVLLV
jgi:hypothetical protein